MSIELMMPSKHLILFCPFRLLPSVFPSIRVFSSESALLIRWPKYWSFSINPSNEYLGLISFRIDWFDLLAAQGTLNRLLQHHSSKASVQSRALMMRLRSFQFYLIVLFSVSQGLQIENYCHELCVSTFSLYLSRPDGDYISSFNGGNTKGIEGNSAGHLPKFCHECGTKYPVEWAKFCCECGVRRMVL